MVVNTVLFFQWWNERSQSTGVEEVGAADIEVKLRRRENRISAEGKFCGGLISGDKMLYLWRRVESPVRKVQGPVLIIYFYLYGEPVLGDMGFAYSLSPI